MWDKIRWMHWKIWEDGINVWVTRIIITRDKGINMNCIGGGRILTSGKYHRSLVRKAWYRQEDGLRQRRRKMVEQSSGE